MAKLADAIERIKTLECPVGEIEDRVAGILEDYEVADRSKINVHRDKRFDQDGAEAYTARIRGAGEQSVMFLAKPGLDDYVTKVIDAYIC